MPPSKIPESTPTRPPPPSRGHHFHNRPVSIHLFILWTPAEMVLQRLLAAQALATQLAGERFEARVDGLMPP